MVYPELVLDPIALTELIPDWKEREDFPLEQWVERESMIALTSETAGIEWPFLPPELHDTGKPIISIAKFQRWLADNASERGIEILTGTAGWNLLYDENGTVRGVRTRDRGLDTDGTPKEEYEPVCRCQCQSHDFRRRSSRHPVKTIDEPILNFKKEETKWPMKWAVKKFFNFQKEQLKMDLFIS